MRLSRYLELLRPHRAALLVAAALLAIGGVLPGVAVWLLQDGLRRLDDPSALAGVAGASVVVVAAWALAQVARASITRRVAGEVASDLRARVWTRWIAQDGGMGQGLSAVLDEVDQVQYGVSALVTAVRNPIALLALVGSAFALAPALAALATVLFAGVAALGAWASRRVKGATADARQARAALAGLAAEQLANADVLRAHGAEPDELRRFRALDDEDRRARLRLEQVRVAPASAVEVAAALAVGLVMVAGSAAVSRGWLDGPALLATVAALLLANRPLSGLTEVQALLARSLSALERVDALLAAAPAPPGLPLPAGPLSLAWDGVAVARGGRIVVDGATLRVDPGEVVALVGPSGAGKTTLLRAGLGALPLARGSATVGGIPAHAADLRGVVGVVPQEIGLFARTVAENVALGHREPDRARVERALAAAGFPHVDPERVLADRGAGLSGGERQRLCLARALYGDARVLVLDEPTAQLDAATAAAFAETLRALAPGRAIVVATHDREVWSRATRVVEVGAWTASSGS